MLQWCNTLPNIISQTIDILWRTLFGLLWNAIPRHLRQRASEKILNFQKRATLCIPFSKVSVYRFTTSVLDLEINHSQLIDLSCDETSLIAIKSKLPKFSLVATCKNEAGSIESWLDSIAKQTTIPQEVVLVDGGSTDETIALATKWHTNQLSNIDTEPQFAFILVSERNKNIAEGRNIAINAASNDLVVLSDVGCKLDSKWAEYLLLPFSNNPNTEVSMGWYEPVCDNDFSRALAYLTVPKLRNIDPGLFLPSARSLAFKKALWKLAGRYPEFLTLAGEDSLFDYYLKQHAKHLAFVPEATVYWSFPASIRKGFKTMYNYSRGDAEGGVIAWQHYYWLLTSLGKVSTFVFLFALITALGLFISYDALIALGAIFGLMPLYLIFELLKRFQPLEHATSPREVFFRLLALFTLIFAQALGFSHGLLCRKNKTCS